LSTFWGIWFISSIVSGIVSSTFAPSKSRSQLSFFFVGFLLGLLGILLCAIAPTAAPEGMKVFKCPRCNSKQNVPAEAREVECWQCHYLSTAGR
jgi:hypothetical protein